MKIAFVSYEYPPDSGWGGIGTYAFQAASLLTGRGHAVEVFSASPEREGTFEQDGVVVHRVRELRRTHFSRAVGRQFQIRHREAPFDVLESPEYLQEGSDAHRLVPTVPLVVKLHSPSALLAQLCDAFDDSLRADFHSYLPQIKDLLGAVAHGRPWPGFFLRHCHRNIAHRRDRMEADFTRQADGIVSPSQALLDMLEKDWALDPARCMVVPNPFVPSPQLLAIEPSPANRTIVFTGRLEVRKGVFDLVEALPAVLDEFPDWNVCFAGRSVPIPNKGIEARDYIQAQLARFGERIRFTGAYSAEDLRGILERAAICVFPSKWENFPNVCLEGMSAGCAVIGSSAGGMAEMISEGVNGLLTPPANPAAITACLRKLMADAALRIRFGRSARETVLSRYNTEICGAGLEESYRRAITAHRAAQAQKQS